MFANNRQSQMTVAIVLAASTVVASSPAAAQHPDVHQQDLQFDPVHIERKHSIQLSGPSERGFFDHDFETGIEGWAERINAYLKHHS
jgi:hypothetical protein